MHEEGTHLDEVGQLATLWGLDLAVNVRARCRLAASRLFSFLFLTASARNAKITAALCFGDVAQLGERCLRMAEVGGSTPLISTTDTMTVDSPLGGSAVFLCRCCVYSATNLYSEHSYNHQKVYYVYFIHQYFD